jgi:hypothetical protein
VKIRYQTIRKLTRIPVALALLAALFSFFQPNVGAWNHSLTIPAIILISSVGGFGALMALLVRVGLVNFIYTDADKKTFAYKMAKSMAERERQSNFGRMFSKSYYQSFELEQESIPYTTLSESLEDPFGKLMGVLSKVVGGAFIVFGVIFLLTGFALLFAHGRNTKLIGMVFVGGSILHIALGVMVIKFVPRIMLRRFGGSSTKEMTL